MKLLLNLNQKFHQLMITKKNKSFGQKAHKRKDKTSKNSPMIGISLFFMHSFVVVSLRTIFILFPEVDFFIMNITTGVVQAIITLPFIFVFLTKRDFSQASNSKFILWMASGLVSVGILLIRIVVMQIPLGTATAIFYLRIVFVMITAYFLINEKSGFSRIGCAFLAVIGVILVVEPPFIFQNLGNPLEGPLWAYLLAFLQPFVMTFSVIFLRKAKDIHFVIMMIACAVYNLLLGSPLLALTKKWALPAKYSEYLAILSIGILSTAATILNVLAHHFCDAAPLATMSALELVLSFLSQIMIFNQIPSIIASIGACIVVISITGLGAAEYLTTRKKKKITEEEDLLSLSMSASSTA